MKKNIIIGENLKPAQTGEQKNIFAHESCEQLQRKLISSLQLEHCVKHRSLKTVTVTVQRVFLCGFKYILPFFGRIPEIEAS